MSESPAKYWDAGDMGCGELVMRLAAEINQIEPGELLEVRSTSPGASADIPAWCRVRGHELLCAEPPVFVIRRST